MSVSAPNQPSQTNGGSGDRPADPGGRFASDHHRRLLGYLPLPSDNYGWTAEALVHRTAPDATMNLESVDEVNTLLSELEDEKVAQRTSIDVDKGSVDIWRQTEQGHELLTGSIANEPGPLEPGQSPTGPAQVGAAVSLDPPADPSLPKGSMAVPGTEPPEESSGEDASQSSGSSASPPPATTSPSQGSSSGPSTTPSTGGTKS